MLHAVVIGINIFSDRRVRRLRYARADAEAFAKLLNDRIHPAERSVRLLCDEQATKERILITIGEELPRVVQPDDVVILYIASHGSPEVDNEDSDASRYLITHNTQYDHVFATGIDMERDLSLLFQRLQRPRLVALFLDTCFSGRGGGRTFEGPHLKRFRASHRQAARPTISIKDLELGEGRVMMAACDDDQVAREDPEFGHGIFTYYLLQELGRPAAGPGVLSINALYDRVTEAVVTRTAGNQVPVINGRLRLAGLPLLG